MKILITASFVFILVVSILNNLPDNYIHAPKGFDMFHKNIPHGTIDTIQYYSKTLGKKRKANVYLPPKYSSRINYPVLYLLHGIGGDEKEWLRNGKLQIILDNLYAENKITSMIVVMPNGRAANDVVVKENTLDKGIIQSFAAFEKDLLNDLIPMVEEKYSVCPDQTHRAIAGLSMGGGQSLNFGLGNPGKFAWIGGFSSASNTRSAKELLLNGDEAKEKIRLLWISCGSGDKMIEFSKRTHRYLVEKNVPHIYYIEPGRHDFRVWKNDLYFFSQLIFKGSDTSPFAKYSFADSLK